ncbi:hypothetical protein [Dyadobacter luticola]|uniref:Uncharacterized protein n=1 Tax=Dyadobacter luticola TaxID=1979387 RepID=A0A5R9L5T3_9BACT|nr:hypothetical protein [Dyadobacter luticola]TLV03707.1 hypothetical protein FEN17_08945 [Dyadobacter luticola]
MKKILISLFIMIPVFRAETTRYELKNPSKVKSTRLEVFEVPANFNWAGNLSSIANKECIISRVHKFSSEINLPKGIKLTFKPGGKLISTTLQKVQNIDLNSWTTKRDVSIVSTKSFSAKKNGRVSAKNVLTTGKVYTIHIKGSTSGSIEVLSTSSLTTFIPAQKGQFDVSYTLKYDESSNAIDIRSVEEGNTTIDAFEVIESNSINSPFGYGSAEEASFPIINNIKGNQALTGAALSGMFKMTNDTVEMSDLFTDNYPSFFFDSFVKTKFRFDRNMVQTGDSEFSVNKDISSQKFIRNKGLSEGCAIEGLNHVSITNLFTFATGDFSISGISIVKGRINICNLYPGLRPLKFKIENVKGIDVRIGNEFPHSSAKSLMTTPLFSNVQLRSTAGKLNTVYLFSTVNAVMTDVQFSFDNYKNEGGQPLIILSSLNGKYTNISSDKGDSGMMFCMFLPKSLIPAIDWVESHAMDFKGFEGNLIHGGNMTNMPEEGFTCDATDSKSPTVTMNRNRFQITKVTDGEHVVVKANYQDKQFQTWINTMMTSMTKGKAGNYSKIVSVVRAKDDNDFTKFIITGPTAFFKDAAIGDKYCVNYAFYNNIIEDMTFTNCRVPILFYLYSYKNIVRRITVRGGFKSSKSGIRQLSYSGRRKRVYLAWSIDNVFENCDLDGNGFQFEDSKNSQEKINPWLTADPEPFESDISEDSEMGTIIRNNTIRNAPMKLQGLRNVTYQGNKLINVKEEITDCTFLVNSNNAGSMATSEITATANARQARSSVASAATRSTDVTQIKETDNVRPVRGSFRSLPKNLTTLQISDTTSLIDGKISELPRSLTFISLKFPIAYNFTPVIRGDLKDLPPNCTYFQDETNGGYYTYSSRKWPENMRKVLIRISVRNSWNSGMIDQLLNDLAATSWTGEKIIDLTGILPKRTSASDSAVSTLAKNGVKVLTN